MSRMNLHDLPVGTTSYTLSVPGGGMLRLIGDEQRAVRCEQHGTHVLQAGNWRHSNYAAVNCCGWGFPLEGAQPGHDAWQRGCVQ